VPSPSQWRCAGRESDRAVAPVPAQDPIQGLTARVLEYEDRPPFVTSERQRLGCPRGIEFGCERVFVLEPPETLRRRLFRGERHRQDRRWVAVLPAAVKVKSAPSRMGSSTYPEGSVMEGILVATAPRGRRFIGEPAWIHREDSRFTKDDRPFDHILQFSNVSRPGIGLQQIQGPLLDNYFLPGLS
jgi:hypothetical protein